MDREMLKQRAQEAAEQGRKLWAELPPTAKERLLSTIISYFEESTADEPASYIKVDPIDMILLVTSAIEQQVTERIVRLLTPFASAELMKLGYKLEKHIFYKEFLIVREPQHIAADGDIDTVYHNALEILDLVGLGDKKAELQAMTERLTSASFRWQVLAIVQFLHKAVSEPPK